MKEFAVGTVVLTVACGIFAVFAMTLEPLAAMVPHRGRPPIIHNDNPLAFMGLVFIVVIVLFVFAHGIGHGVLQWQKTRKK